MKVLVVGSGGREHALSWVLSKSKRVEKVFVAPGNPGMDEAKIETLPELAASDFAQIKNFLLEKKIDLCVIGPDQALADGIVDFLKDQVVVLGPTKQAARIESSKAFSKELMGKAKIPTAKHFVFSSLSELEKFSQSQDWGDGWVVKADGLALGKGVVVCENWPHVISSAKRMFAGEMGDAGTTIVLEERLLGRELSGFYLCDGITYRELGFACDYKRLLDNNMGPNTGGMGSYSPVDWLVEADKKKISETIVEPLLKQMKSEEFPFVGFLFVGLMMTSSGPKVIEFNARSGDPETQTYLPRLEEDLAELFLAAAKGELSSYSKALRTSQQTAVHIVLAAEGYPGTEGKSVVKGDLIQVSDDLKRATDDCKVFYAGVKKKDQDLITSGGRVLGLTVFAKDRESARALAYEKIEKIQFRGLQKRRDIGL
ncbi:MAG: phosphoribosylamine--glycine ligase [Oligoflexia bacterium]|nr:phosphoribosylamine--glycine ligase [Oligoflexia bacterium]